jgi:hypothetical protein
MLRRWWELLPEAALAVGLTVFLAQETDAATSAFESGRAIALMAVTAVGWVVARLVLQRFVRVAAVRVAVFAVAAAAVLAVVVLPAYDDTTVVEALPRRSAATAAVAEEALPAQAPARVGVASFRGVDHRAEGTVALYRHSDGTYVVGLEDIDIQPGPDYDVYVVPGADREDRDGGVRLDDLRGNKGTQYYDVPPEADLDSGAWTVLVWCQVFAVPIATATPA